MNGIAVLCRIHKDKLGEIIRFGITGVASTVTTYLVYYVCLLRVNPTIAFSIGYIVAMCLNYLLTILFTFKVKATAKNAVGFILSNGVNYLLCTLFLNIFIWCGVGENLAPIPMYVICIPINFIIVRFIMRK